MNTTTSAHRQFLAYFVPLALQSISQSLTYPLVAMVASRGSGGPLNMAGLAQATAVMGLIWTLGAGLITAGMVYGKTREGFNQFVRLNNRVTLLVTGIYLVLAIPPVAHLMFGRLLGLPPSIEAPARLAYWCCLPMLVLFYLRIPYQVVLFNSNATAKAFIATLARILLALVLAAVFCRLGAVGPVWAVAALTISVAMELVMSQVFARPYIPRLIAGAGAPPQYGEMFLFSITLSIGAVFVTLTGFMMAAFISRAPYPEHMLPVYYLAMGLAGPVGFGAHRLQALVINFYGITAEQDRRLFRFSMAVGLVMGFLPLLFLAPGLMEWYYITLQKLDPADLRLVFETALALLPFPLVVGLRAYSEGQAAWHRRPVLVLTGQAVYLAMVVVISFFALNLRVSGHLIGPFALLGANLIGAGVIFYSIWWERQRRMPDQVSEINPDLK